ncbi:MAG: 5-formyltetrahydrofolate cyclo-ligase [Promethearchaeota archaeon]
MRRKSEIRQEVLNKRNRLRLEEIEIKSEQVGINLFSLKEFEQAETVLFYVAKGSEVATLPMIESVIGLKRVFVPISVRRRRKLVYSEIYSIDELEPGAYGILRPRRDSRRILPLEQLASEAGIVIVPGVVFDEKGFRTGYGAGFYDRFLTAFRYHHASTALFIALAFELQIVEDTFPEKHDVPVDMIITERRIINCRR